MGQRYLMDTNAVIDYLDKKLPSKSLNLIYDTDGQISVITRMELLASPNATKNELHVLKNFIKTSTVYYMDESIILKSIDIRKNYRLKLPDAIIAATAVVKKFTLITRNVADFKGIPNLSLLNSWE